MRIRIHITGCTHSIQLGQLFTSLISIRIWIRIEAAAGPGSGSILQQIRITDAKGVSDSGMIFVLTMSFNMLLLRR